MISPAWVVSRASEIPAARAAGSVVPTLERTSKVEIIQVTVPSRPKIGRMVAKTAIVERYFSIICSSLKTIS